MDRRMPYDEQQPRWNMRPVRMVLQMLASGQESTLMDTRIANRAMVTIHVISQAALVIAMGMILIVIGASIYRMLGTTH